MNKTLMETERIILNGVGITQEFSTKAIKNAKYLVNMYPLSTLVE
jgi:hypothetical protein